jgi:hypothetical protein
MIKSAMFSAYYHSRRRLTRPLALLCMGMLLWCAGATETAAKDKKDAARDARIAMIRALGQEVAVTKVEYPRGKQGIFVDGQGTLDQAKSKEEVRRNGLALKPGTPVQITKLDFKSDRVKIELNGGGKKNKKWYEHIQVGMGSTTTPVTTQSAAPVYGSAVTLVFPGKIETATPELVKKLLDGVLDFERHSPTVLYSPEVPAEFKEAIKNHQVILGMDRDAVLSAKGPPERKVREVRDGVETEDWIYGLPPNVLFVTFDGDRVVKVRQF